MSALLRVLTILCLAAAAAYAGEFDCRTCEGRGIRPCAEHDESECLREGELRYCSHYLGCTACGEIGWVDCPECEDGEPTAELARRVVDWRNRAASHAKFAEEMGRPLRIGESEHFVLIWELDRYKVDKKLLAGHELLHLYLSRLERLYDEYTTALALAGRSFPAKPVVMIWWSPDDQERASLRFVETKSTSGAKMLGARPLFTVLGNSSQLRKDEDLHRSVIHNVAHLLLSNQTPSYWLGNIGSGWVDAGIAHYFEDKLTGLCTNYCYQEQNTLVDFKGGKWRPAIRKMVAEGKAASFASVAGKNTDQLTPPEHALAMSWVEYLLVQDGAKFTRLVQRLKSRAETRDALKDAYQLTPISFEELWRAWVLETYPKR